MTQDEIIRFAIQCRLVTTGNRDGLYMNALTEFANLVDAKEREACAKVCEANVWSKPVAWWGEATKSEVSVEAGLQCAIAIRARGELA